MDGCIAHWRYGRISPELVREEEAEEEETDVRTPGLGATSAQPLVSCSAMRHFGT